MEAIFNSPMASIQLQQTSRIRFFFRKAGNSINDFFCLFTRFKVGKFSMDTQNLSNVGKVKIIIQLGTGPDLADLQTAMSLIDTLVLRGENRPGEGLGYPFLTFSDYP